MSRRRHGRAAHAGMAAAPAVGLVVAVCGHGGGGEAPFERPVISWLADD